MTPSIAQVIVFLLGAYLALGLCFALAFVARGAARIDPAARGMPWTVRALIAPGATLLWPVLMQRWIASRASRPS